MIVLGNKNELFIDDYLIETKERITLELLRPQRKEEVFAADMERGEAGMNTAGYFSAVPLPNGQVYMYYRGMKDGKECTRLLISDDGIRFRKAETGNENIVLTDGRATHNLAPFYDDNPACKEDERFKAVGGGGDETYVPETNSRGIYILKSADGIHWSFMQETPVIKDGWFDSLNTVFWSKITGKYHCYSRYFTGIVPPVSAETEGLRAIQSCVSDDFIHWSPQIRNTYNGQEPTYAYYTNATRPIPGAEHILASMPMRANFDRKKVPTHPFVGLCDNVFLTSRDGNDWFSYNDRAWVYPGIGDRNWTDRNHPVAPGIVDKNDEFSFYVVERYRWENTCLVRYVLPKLRLGYAYGLNGKIVTKPFLLDGDRLTFNYNTSVMGTLCVEVLDEVGMKIDGYSFELFGNELAAPVDLRELRGRRIRLKLTLKDAYLYSIGY